MVSHHHDEPRQPLKVPGDTTTLSLPSRMRASNAWRATATDVRLFVVASRIVSQDRLEIALRSEFDGTFENAKQHAIALAAAVSNRFNCAACCDIVDSEGMPLFSYAMEAAR